MTSYKIFPTTLILLFTFQINAQSLFMTNIDGEMQTLEQRRNAHEVNGSQLVIVRNFEIDTTIYSGMRDMENGLKVDKNTRFQLGSMTGALTKFAIVRLVNDGKIELDAPANQYLKSWKINEKSFTKKDPVTIKDLLTQRRGFTDIYKPKGYAPGESLPTLIQILNGEQPSNLGAMTLKKNQNKSGNSSMANCMILQQILEDIHGMPFTKIIEDQVFKPVGMNRSVISAARPDDAENNTAIGYDDKNRRLKNDHAVHPELAVAGLWSTAEDYTKFVMHIFKAAAGIDNTLLQQDLAKASINPEFGNHSLVLLKNKTSYWGGAPKGFYSQFAGDYEEGWMVIAVTNKFLCWKHVNWELLPRGEEYAKRELNTKSK